MPIWNAVSKGRSRKKNAALIWVFSDPGPTPLHPKLGGEKCPKLLDLVKPPSPLPPFYPKFQNCWFTKNPQNFWIGLDPPQYQKYPN